MHVSSKDGSVLFHYFQGRPLEPLPSLGGLARPAVIFVTMLADSHPTAPSLHIGNLLHCSRDMTVLHAGQLSRMI